MASITTIKIYTIGTAMAAPIAALIQSLVSCDISFLLSDAPSVARWLFGFWPAVMPAYQCVVTALVVYDRAAIAALEGLNRAPVGCCCMDTSLSVFFFEQIKF